MKIPCISIILLLSIIQLCESFVTQRTITDVISFRRPVKLTVMYGKKKIKVGAKAAKKELYRQKAIKTRAAFQKQQARLKKTNKALANETETTTL